MRLHYLLPLLILSCATPKHCFQLPQSKGALEQQARAVSISVTCGSDRWGGSGVILDQRHVLTDYHVAGCDLPSMIIVTADSKEHIMLLEAGSKQNDLARLMLLDDSSLLPKLPPLVMGPIPDSGYSVCVATGMPSADYRCGVVEKNDGDVTGNLYHSIVVEHGNSGSGTYDYEGRLVGLVSHLRLLRNGQIGGGISTTLANHAWIFAGKPPSEK